MGTGSAYCRRSVHGTSLPRNLQNAAATKSSTDVDQPVRRPVTSCWVWFLVNPASKYVSKDAFARKVTLGTRMASAFQHPNVLYLNLFVPQMRSSKPAELLVQKHAIQFANLMRPEFALFNVSLDVLVRMASYGITMVVAFCRLNVQLCQKNLLSLCQNALKTKCFPNVELLVRTLVIISTMQSPDLAPGTALLAASVRKGSYGTTGASACSHPSVRVRTHLRFLVFYSPLAQNVVPMSCTTSVEQLAQKRAIRSTDWLKTEPASCCASPDASAKMAL
uniref:(northern house mosquito) hypothetical protein n=2 Tax=Culex pipiens TaxID=7175 RepID=A0A8D8CJ96_CULPI